MATTPLKCEPLDATRWRLPRQGTMRVDGIIFADERLMQSIASDASLTQLANVASLPGVVEPVLAMPDIHWGYGFPIGGVAAFDPQRGGVVSPGGVGYDINCGVRLHSLDVDRAQVDTARDRIAHELSRSVPAGVGRGRADPHLRDLDDVLVRGAKALVDPGLVPEQDMEAMEERGCLPGANPDAVSARARERGADQLGSLGSGNHFLELDAVAEIHDPATAHLLGLRLGGTALLIHSGSRGLGHQVCAEMLGTMLHASRKAGIDLPDKQLACAPLGSTEANRYLGAMAAAANFAFANRALLAHRALHALASALRIPETQLGARLVHDVCHNVAKWEDHTVGGSSRRLCVHRKGATRAFGPGHPALAAGFQSMGQPVIIPGDMERGSYVLCGTRQAMALSFGSACHGAGRVLGRSKARSMASGKSIVQELAARGITLKAANVADVPEEASFAYKDVANVVDVVHRAGLARIIARLEPLIVIKG